MKRVARKLAASGLSLLSHAWAPHSRLILVGDVSGWVLDWEMRALKAIAHRLGIPTLGRAWQLMPRSQAVFHASQYFLTDNPGWTSTPHRVGFAYYHGKPGTGEPGFDRLFDQVCRHHERLQRIQVSHTEMYNTVLQSGIDPAKVFMIPIGIDLSLFRFQDTESRRRTRRRLEIPDEAFVVGSMQKDGVGWGDGLEPKLIKGPDVLLQTLEALRNSIPGLFVLLTGPARGYVKAGLERRGIPYRAVAWMQYPQVGRLFSALDLYLVSSRQEGGPKAVLEAMASGVPLVTTRVGQAMDLVRHGQNAWMVEVEDVEGLAHWSRYVHEHQGPALDAVLQAGRVTAEENSYEAQTPRWSDFMDGFVEWEK